MFINQYLAALAYAHNPMFNETEFLKLMLPFLVKALGLTEEQIKEKGMTADGVTDLEKEYGKKLKARFDDGHKAAEGKSQKSLNDLAKTVFGVETEGKTLQETLEAIKTTYTPPGDPSKITDNDVKKHSLYLQIEQRAKKAEDDLKTANENYDSRITKEVARLNLQQRAESALTELKAILPTHEGQKKVMVDQYRNAFANIEERKEGDQSYYYEGDKRLEDNMGNPLSWDQVKKQRAEQFFELGTPDRDPVNPPKPGDKPPVARTLQPKTEAELIAVLADDSVSLEDQNKAKAYWDSTQKS